MSEAIAPPLDVAFLCEGDRTPKPPQRQLVRMIYAKSQGSRLLEINDFTFA